MIASHKSPLEHPIATSATKDPITVSHWDTYRVTGVTPFEYDPEPSPMIEVMPGVVHDANYESWCENNGVDVAPKWLLGRWMKGHGFPSKSIRAKGAEPHKAYIGLRPCSLHRLRPLMAGCPSPLKLGHYFVPDRGDCDGSERWCQAKANQSPNCQSV
jgi:hypothetical protein